MDHKGNSMSRKYSTFIFTLISCIIISTSLTGCFSGKGVTSYPVDGEQERRIKRGKLTGEGGLKLFGGGSKKVNSGTGINVNSFLWRATLDTISFMPLASTDPHGGVIITDWYEDPDAKGERFKINILILGTELRTNGLRVSAFRQVRKKSGNWRDAKVGAKVARNLEDKILTRARELRINNIK